MTFILARPFCSYTCNPSKCFHRQREVRASRRCRRWTAQICGSWLVRGMGPVPEGSESLAFRGRQRGRVPTSRRCG
eukprot:4500052-Pleurochrysis_carterae.AAC.1